MKEILVYYDDITDVFYETNSKAIIKRAKERGYIGYVSGFRYFNNKTDSVMVFFKEKPSIMEVERRRQNGLKKAKFYFC